MNGQAGWDGGYVPEAFFPGGRSKKCVLPHLSPSQVLKAVIAPAYTKLDRRPLPLLQTQKSTHSYGNSETRKTKLVPPNKYTT